MEHEKAYDSTSYCEKSDTRLKKPWFHGTESYKYAKNGMTLSLRKWQEQFLELIENEIYREALKDRKVMVILD